MNKDIVSMDGDMKVDQKVQAIIRPGPATGEKGNSNSSTVEMAFDSS